jgi:phospholipid/cholesterol/gamma-HCH transport system ATP-binding protein
LNEPGRAIGHAEHIVIEHLHKNYGPREVLRDINLGIPRSKTTVILGGSGAGKTTLGRMLIGLDRPTAGHIWVDGDDIAVLGDVKLNQIRRKFGMVFQYAALLDSLTVLDNVAFPLREHSKMSARQIQEAVSEKLELLGLHGVEKLYPSQLSGGMRKRVGIARALILQPEILIYDEPTSGLDPTSSRSVDDIIEQMREMFQVTSVVISHDMTSTFRIAHYACLLVNGRIEAAGTPDSLLNGKSQAVHDFIAASGIDASRVSRPPS